MTIKTGKRIEIECQNSDKEWSKRYIAVDDLIRVINEFQSKKKQITDKIMIQQELKDMLIKGIKKTE